MAMGFHHCKITNAISLQQPLGAFSNSEMYSYRICYYLFIFFNVTARPTTQSYATFLFLVNNLLVQNNTRLQQLDTGELLPLVLVEDLY
ncbi:unnamed protein product [Amoebophrya sp. A120]|nr:unnamed protein product [Amoebophrya sp. A120]|eukprot:GSA120T00024381001.1